MRRTSAQAADVFVDYSQDREAFGGPPVAISAWFQADWNSGEGHPGRGDGPAATLHPQGRGVGCR